MESTRADDVLISRIKDGDKTAFEELYRLYSSMLHRFILKKGLDRDDAKDVIQDVFETVWNKRTSLNPQMNIASYLYKSVSNKSLDIFRHNLVKEAYVISFEKFRSSQDLPLESVIENADLMALILREIASLPPKTREIMELRLSGQLNNQEIGEKLNLSQDAVKSHIKRGIKVLRSKENRWILAAFFS